ncbi:MAG: hypothetical protein RIT81_17640 [Deltaproteobacteria bacterium]
MSIRSGDDPAAWGRAFADLGEATRFDFYDVLVTLNRLAGSDELQVRRFQIAGDAVDVEVSSER